MDIFDILSLIFQFCVAPLFIFHLHTSILSLTQHIHPQKIIFKWKPSPTHRNRSLTQFGKSENAPFIILC